MSTLFKTPRRVDAISKEIKRWEGTQRRITWQRGGANRDIEAILGDLYTELTQAKIESAHAASIRARDRGVREKRWTRVAAILGGAR
tara:strand:+ start:1133 stop:1393 length:261 start_codon:yes stop_codon:yes gene_type:complete